MNKFIEIAKNMAIDSAALGNGGPFGAVITDKNGEIISTGTNHVLANLDPTAHAEIEAIRSACKKLGTYDLSGYILYTVCYPCPMCLSAIIWSNIKEVFYACTKEDASCIGFRDDFIYEYIKGSNKDLIDFKEIDRSACIEIFDKYKEMGGIIY